MPDICTRPSGCIVGPGGAGVLGSLVTYRDFDPAGDAAGLDEKGNQIRGTRTSNSGRGGLAEDDELHGRDRDISPSLASEYKSRVTCGNKYPAIKLVGQAKMNLHNNYWQGSPMRQQCGRSG